jgi:hypothetical protein
MREETAGSMQPKAISQQYSATDQSPQFLVSLNLCDSVFTVMKI